MITCQGRDQIVNVQFGQKSLVIVNFHFERELNLRCLRKRLRLITLHWPSYSNAVDIILGDFNISEFESVYLHESPTSCVFPLRVLVKFSHTMWNPLMELSLHEQISGAVGSFVDELTWLRSHALVILLLIHSALCHQDGAHNSA